MSLLTIVQEAAILCNLPSPTSVVNSTDPNTTLLLALANKEGQELARRHDWNVLTAQNFSFTSVATEEQTALPSDVDRLLPNPELWNQSLSQKYTGPVSARAWQELQALSVTAGSPGWWRLWITSVAPFSPTIWITPAPTAGETIAIPVIFNTWTIDSGYTLAGDAWVADTNIGLISERLMTLGIIWRYKRAKGLDYAEDMSTYEREVERACSRDRGVNVLRLRRSSIDDLPPPTWPGTITV